MQENYIQRIRTDRERFNGIAKYDSDNQISLEEVFNHIKIRHRYDTNCISLTINVCVAIDYGREYYNDEYIVVRVPKNDFGNVYIVGLYMISEINKKIQVLSDNGELTSIEEYFLSKIDDDKNQEKLNIIIDELRRIKNTSQSFEDEFNFNILLRKII